MAFVAQRSRQRSRIRCLRSISASSVFIRFQGVVRILLVPGVGTLPGRVKRTVLSTSGNDRLAFSHDSEKRPQGNRGRNVRTMSPQPPGSPDSGKPGSSLRNRIPLVGLADFRARLDTRQIESELDSLFRESPEFGRNLAHRLSPFLETPESGSLTLIGAGGEAAVFGDPANQQVVKLCGPPARCRFGWLR